MKICPKCGAKMDANVNFCINCGTDLRKVPVTTDNKQTKAAPTTPTSENSNVQSREDQRQENNASQFTNQIANAARSFDAHSLWQWFVNSWKHPTADQNAENWYGWVTILVENLLLIIGMAIALHNSVNSSRLGSFLSGTQEGQELQSGTFGGLVELFLFLVLYAFITILLSYLAHKFVYGGSIPVLQYINKVVQIGNLAAIFDVLAFLLLIIGQITPGTFFISLSLLMFYYSSLMVVVADDNAIRDKFYGLLIFIVLDLIVSLILFSLFGSMLWSQIKSLGGNMFQNEFQGYGF